MTIGIGGWGSRRKPMALVRAILRSPLKNLTVVSYAGPDVGLLVASGQAKRVVTGFASLDSIALEPHFRRARQDGTVELTELDEGMLHWGLLAAAHRLPFLPIRAGLGSGVLEVNPGLRTVRSPYGDPFGLGEELVAVPALRLDAALVHMNRADAAGNAQYLGPDPYFDDLFCLAAERAYVSCEQIVPRLDGPAADHAAQPGHGARRGARPRTARTSPAASPTTPGTRRSRRGTPRPPPTPRSGQSSAPGTWKAPRRRTRKRCGHDRRGNQGRGLRGGLRRGVARRRRDPGQPDGADPGRWAPGWPGSRSRPACCSPTARPT